MSDNKRNLLYFESSSVRELYNTMESWQAENEKRLLSVNIQRDGDQFCCIALTNPTEVVITDNGDHSHHAAVSHDGYLFTYPG